MWRFVQGYGTGNINEVALRRARLVLRWVTVRGYIVLVRDKPIKQTSAKGAVAMIYGWKGNRRSGVVTAMYHRRRIHLMV